ncbi:response regulator [Oxynema sp. CENA135]|uniref:ATP-binding protein n=1 Tax=Oxynema sp. CENA135 TaxID=984206 RepID=UPI0019096039|nr:response regulator [Oxynema sp. CENA135]
MKNQGVKLLKQDILIVDDTPDNLRVLSSLLASHGYLVRKALNGPLALQACQKQLPDLILLDIMMPEMDGYEVCNHLKSDPTTQKIPVIFISALDNPFDKVKAFNIGGADYITKPVQAEEAIARVSHQLTIAEQQRQLAEQNAQLQQLNQKLKRSNADLEQFAYHVAHDLRSPIQSIILFAELAEDRFQDCLGTKGRDYMEGIINSGLRMKDTIDNLLAYSRVELSQNNFQLTDCEQVLSEALANLAEEIRSSGAVITHSNLPTPIADRTQLVRLFQNLIGNGIKFRDTGIVPQIKIGAESIGDREWMFSVQDNGIGIDRESFERIFEIFERLDTSKKYPGSGIGMAICKKIVERHGGKIWLESELGRGTTFYFTLPAQGSVNP